VATSTADPDYAYSTNGSILGTTNGGKTWTGQILPPTSPNFSYSYANGNASVTWQTPPSPGTSPIIGYSVTFESNYPGANDRLPTPPGEGGGIFVSASTRSVSYGNLLEDCHQRYYIEIQPENSEGIGEASFSYSDFRPSGNVIQGQAPPYVVVLLDGIGESQPGFTMDPYKPTLDGLPSYCPESWNSSKGQEAEADFGGSPNGPWSFFHKWNYGEVDSNGNATGSNPDKTTPNTESMPRAWPGNAAGLPSGTDTHSFMLDALAAQGAIILPFSYSGWSLSAGSNGGDPSFTYDAYNVCLSTPGCGPSIQDDAKSLNTLVDTIAGIWPLSEIIVMGHSQGGLIASTWWACANASSVPDYCNGGKFQTTVNNSVGAVFSLDSPINGACLQLIICTGPPSYPTYTDRTTFDPQLLGIDASDHDLFHFIGTWGDSPAGGYQSGTETIEHQLLFDYSHYSHTTIDSLCANPNNESGCPLSTPPDHLSECPVNNPPTWATAHYVEKFCPGDVDYFNSVLGLYYG